VIDRETIENSMVDLAKDVIREGQYDIQKVAINISTLTKTSMHPFNFTLMCAYMQISNLSAMLEVAPELPLEDRMIIAARLDNFERSIDISRDLLVEVRKAMGGVN
jgi:hypothetical protein